MTEAFPHIAIVDDEFLIAVDAEYLIKEALECRTTLIRPDQVAHWTDRDLSKLDLCLVDLPLRAAGATAMASRLEGLKVPFLFTSVSEQLRRGVQTFQGIPVIMKPYDGEVLVAAIRTMLGSARS